MTFIAAGATAATVDSASSAYQINPAHDGRVVFSHAFAPPLKQKWSVNLGGLVSYPVTSGNLAVVDFTNSKASFLAAYALDSGRQIWIKRLPGGAGDAYLASDAGTIFVADTDQPMRAFRAADGKALWTSASMQYVISIMPVAANGYVYGGAFDGNYLFGLDEKTGTKVWSAFEFGDGVGPTVGGGKVYFPHACNVPAYASASGKQIWYYNLGCVGGGGAVAAYYEGHLYAPYISDPGAGVIMETGTGVLLGGLAGYATPAFSAGMMYAISGTAMVASDISTGNLDWSFAPEDSFTVPPITINGNVYSLSSQGVLYVNAGKTGRLLQTIKVCAAVPDDGGLRGLGAAQNTLLVPCGRTLTAFGP